MRVQEGEWGWGGLGGRARRGVVGLVPTGLLLRRKYQTAIFLRISRRETSWELLAFTRAGSRVESTAFIWGW